MTKRAVPERVRFHPFWSTARASRIVRYIALTSASSRPSSAWRVEVCPVSTCVSGLTRAPRLSRRRYLLHVGQLRDRAFGLAVVCGGGRDAFGLGQVEDL